VGGRETNPNPSSSVGNLLGSCRERRRSRHRYHRGQNHCPSHTQAIDCPCPMGASKNTHSFPLSLPPFLKHLPQSELQRG